MQRTSEAGVSGTRWRVLKIAAVVAAFAVAISAGIAYKRLVVAPDRSAPSSLLSAATIEGVVVRPYPPSQHVDGSERVAYETAPPYGGAHDQIWATCTGIVYPAPIRSENAVHSLEHGAVWITYNPTAIDGDKLRALQSRVQGKPYTFMSPYPLLDTPFSLQAWGHQLRLNDVADPRVDQFIAALRQNPVTSPEPNATCSTIEPRLFDPASPPPFDASPPGPDAVPETDSPS